jgi:hypothetical protein
VLVIAALFTAAAILIGAILTAIQGDAWGLFATLNPRKIKLLERAMLEPIIAVTCDDPAKVVLAIQASFEIEFEERDSAYKGDYWKSKKPATLIVYRNRDPLFQPEVDPPDELYFESDYRECGVLVDVAGNVEILIRLAEVLRPIFPGLHVRVGNPFIPPPPSDSWQGDS